MLCKSGVPFVTMTTCDVDIQDGVH